MFELLELKTSIPYNYSNNFNSFEGPNGKYLKLGDKNIMYCNGKKANRSRFLFILKDKWRCKLFVIDSKLTAPVFLCGEEEGAAVTISDAREATIWSF